MDRFVNAAGGVKKGLVKGNSYSRKGKGKKIAGNSLCYEKKDREEKEREGKKAYALIPTEMAGGVT